MHASKVGCRYLCVRSAQMLLRYRGRGIGGLAIYGNSDDGIDEVPALEEASVYWHSPRARKAVLYRRSVVDGNIKMLVQAFVLPGVGLRKGRSEERESDVAISRFLNT